MTHYGMSSPDPVNVFGVVLAFADRAEFLVLTSRQV